MKNQKSNVTPRVKPGALMITIEGESIAEIQNKIRTLAQEFGVLSPKGKDSSDPKRKF